MLRETLLTLEKTGKDFKQGKETLVTLLGKENAKKNPKI